jgi:hypothetical protein
MFNHVSLTLIWGFLYAFILFAYVALDGFDLGVGILFAARRGKDDRDLMVESFAPVWDGNETWIVIGAAGLLGAFQVFVRLHVGWRCHDEEHVDDAPELPGQLDGDQRRPPGVEGAVEGHEHVAEHPGGLLARLCRFGICARLLVHGGPPRWVSGAQR